MPTLQSRKPRLLERCFFSLMSMGITGGPHSTADRASVGVAGALLTGSQGALMLLVHGPRLGWQRAEAQSHAREVTQHLAEQRLTPRGLTAAAFSHDPRRPLSSKEERGVTQDGVCCLTSSPPGVCIGRPRLRQPHVTACQSPRLYPTKHFLGEAESEGTAGEEGREAAPGGKRPTSGNQACAER